MSTSPKDAKPILFSGPMVRAILDGRKTQTRRVLPQPPENVTSAGVFSNSADGVLDEWSWLSGDPRDFDTWEFEGDFVTGYRPGQIRYVREAWAARLDEDHIRARDLTRTQAFFWADGPGRCCNTGCAGGAGRVRASMHLPRRMSRLTLEITEVRVQRLQEISEEDAAAEGTLEPYLGDGDPPFEEQAIMVSRRMQFRNLWNSLNAKPRPIYAPDANGKKGIIGYVSYPWEAGRRVETFRDRPHQIFGNPWVVAASFEPHQQNVDDFLKARSR